MGGLESGEVRFAKLADLRHGWVYPALEVPDDGCSATFPACPRFAVCAAQAACQQAADNSGLAGQWPVLGRSVRLWEIALWIPWNIKLLSGVRCFERWLAPLKHDRVGQWSIRVNDQWRICFRFEQGDAYDVEIVDYH
jgi:hypothetical protein